MLLHHCAVWFLRTINNLIIDLVLTLRLKIRGDMRNNNTKVLNNITEQTDFS